MKRLTKATRKQIITSWRRTLGPDAPEQRVQLQAAREIDEITARREFAAKRKERRARA